MLPNGSLRKNPVFAIKYTEILLLNAVYRKVKLHENGMNFFVLNWKKRNSAPEQTFEKDKQQKKS